MTLSDESDCPSPQGMSKAVERLLQQYCSDPQAPRLDEIRRMAEEMLTRNSELESKVTNLRKIVQQLEAYRDRYVDLYELAPVGYVTLDEEGYVQEINLAGSQMFGLDRAELIGYPFEDHVSAHDSRRFKDQIGKCCGQRQAITCEVNIVTKDGTPLPVQIRGVPVESLKSDEVFCKLAITDITERKMVEEAIRASEANYRAIFDTANDAIFIHDADTGEILDANQEATEMYGYTVDEFRQINVETISEGNPPYTQNEASQWVQRAVAGLPQHFDWKAKNKKGRVFWVGVNLKRTALNGQPRLLAIVRDISERKEAEEALRASEERFRTVADYTYDWEYWRGADGRFQYVSPSCERITGYSPDEFMADPALLERIVHPDDRQKVVGHFKGELPRAATHTAEYRIISRSGEERWIEHICQPVFGVDKRWLGQRASNRDITDRKRAELILHKEQQPDSLK
jgi:PAS domain S-box-containing protein